MQPTITKAYPPIPLPELLDLIDAFGSMSLEEKKAFLVRLVRTHVTLSLEWGKGWTYRRTRKLDPGVRPETVDELVWRKGMPARLGRANPAGFEVLYLSDRMDTALREAGVQHDTVAVAEFAVRDDRSLRVAPIGEFTQVQRTGRGYLLGAHSDLITKLLNACDPDEALSMMITDAFLQERFLSDDSYELSSQIALAIFRKDPEIAAVAFQSRRQPGGVNFAVRVETFWRDWALIGVRFGEARHLACGYYRLVNTQAVDGIFQDGTLRWADVAPRERVLLEPYVPIDGNPEP
jgi:hypothetical protein